MKRAVILAVLASQLGGCGTLINFSQEHHDQSTVRIYGGVLSDLEALTIPFTRRLPNQSILMRFLHIPLGLIDLPFSILADTLTLPLTISPGPARKEFNPEEEEEVERKR